MKGEYLCKYLQNIGGKMKNISEMRKFINTMSIDEKQWNALNCFQCILSFTSKCEHLDEGTFYEGADWDIDVGLYPGQLGSIKKDPDLYVGLNCQVTPDSDEVWLSELMTFNPRLANEIICKLKEKFGGNDESKLR